MNFYNECFNTNNCMRIFKKVVLITTGIIVLVALLIILFISPISKYLVEKYDEKYTGRQIKMDWAIVNPFTGFIHLKNTKVYEYKSDSVFFSTNDLNFTVNIRKLFSSQYEITNIILEHPVVKIIQVKKTFNFNDLIKKFSSDKPKDTTASPVHFNINTVKINDGEFYFNDKTTPINYFVKNTYIESKGFQWNQDTIEIKYSFVPGIGTGKFRGNFIINTANNDYQLGAVINKFNLDIIEQYFKSLSNYGSFAAILDADIKATGNFNDAQNVNATGMLALSDFHFGKTKKEDFISFDKLVFGIHQLSPKYQKYLFDSVLLTHPYFKYEQYDNLNNLETMFGKSGSNLTEANQDPAKFNLILEIANYIKELSRNFFRSDYKITRLGVYEGDFKFNDFSLSEQFAMHAKPIRITADSIDKNDKRVHLYLKSRIQPYSNLAITLSMNPKDSNDFNIYYNLEKFPATMLNPYLISSTSFPLDRGTIELKGNWNVSNGNISSQNHLSIVDPRVTKKIKNNGTGWIPMRLVMAFVRERGNVIDYEIPITGNINNPQFHLNDVIMDVLKNIFVKPVTTPYRMQVKEVETEIEKSLTLKWRMNNSELSNKQEKFIEKIAHFLYKTPEASIEVQPQQYALKEKEHILFFEAKKKYFIHANNIKGNTLSESDSESVERMSVKDSAFVRYLNNHLKKSLTFTIQDKCAQLIDESIVNNKFKQLNEQREKKFLSFFDKNDIGKRIKINKPETVIPYNGFSLYKIEYKGEMPKDLKKAYDDLDELNQEKPRKKFKEEHQENKDKL